MRNYKINNFNHIVYDDGDPIPDDIKVISNWRDGSKGDWVLSDDNCIIQILREGKLATKSKNCPKRYIGTCCGTFAVKDNVYMDTEKRHNIYSFGGTKTSSKNMFDREKLNNRESAFSVLIAKGVSPVKAYMQVYETNNPKYADKKSLLLMKTERVKTAVKKELEPVLGELGIDARFVLKEIKDLIENTSQDDVRLRALIKLGDVLSIEDKGQKESQVAMIGFQGFKPEQLEAVEKIKELKE
jgi:hypothetical protein